MSPKLQPPMGPKINAHAARRHHLCGMSFFFTGRSRLPHGQTHAEMRASHFGFENLDAAVVCIDEFSHHRQSDSRSLDVSSLRRLSLIKSLEYPIALLGRNPRPAVHDVEYQLLALGARMNRDRAATRGELDGVRQQVVEDQANLAAVSERREILDLHIEAHAL